MSMSALEYTPTEIFAVKQVHLRSGMSLFLSSGKFSKDTCHRAAVTSPMFELSYNLNIPLCSQVGNSLVEVLPGHSCLGFMNNIRSETHYHEGEEISYLSIWLEPKVFTLFLQGLGEKVSFDFFSFLSRSKYQNLQYKMDTLDKRILAKLHKGLNNELCRMNLLLIESQILELLSMNMERLLGLENKENNGISLSFDDKCSLLKARDILLSRLENPPSILELSHLVQMNDCKLKRTFKQVFGETIYSFVREQRLQKAFFLMEEQDFNVSQSAYAVGYSNVSHFSEAFRLRFGFNPSQLLISR